MLELKHEEYSVNTSKGNFIVKKIKKDEMPSIFYNDEITNIIIERENKTIFGEYRLDSYYKKNNRYFPISYKESLNFYPEKINFEHGFKITDDKEIIIYDNRSVRQGY